MAERAGDVEGRTVMQENNKLQFFEDQPIRTVWDEEAEEWYFSIIDVVKVLTEQPDSRRAAKYWSVLKVRLSNEGSELTTNCSQLKMLSSDGKIRLRDAMDTNNIFRLIESIPSSKAEPFKLWLAKLGHQKIDEVFDPSKGIDEMINFYLTKGYTLEWIEHRIKAIINRKKLTQVWQDSGINENVEFAMLTNEIYKEWSGMTASEYKNFKGIRKENLRDNMTDIEVILTDLGETATRELVKEKKPGNLEENRKVSKLGGEVAKVAKENLENKLNKSVISKNNNLNYTYNNKL